MTSADVEAMCKKLNAKFFYPVDPLITETIAMLRSLDARVQTEIRCGVQVYEDSKAKDERIAALEAERDEWRHKYERNDRLWQAHWIKETQPDGT